MLAANCFLLKAIHFILPILALVLVGTWNVGQLRSISSLEQDDTDLRKKISAAPALGNLQPEASLADRHVRKTGSAGGEPIHWKELSARLQIMQKSSGTSDMRAMMKVQQQLAEMSKPEMTAALDAIAGLDLSPEARQLLESMVLDPLIQLDPEYALERFANRIEDYATGLGWQLSSALAAWAQKDLAAATAWFDRQITAGNFESKTLDGKSEMRVQFEASLMGELLAADPTAAGHRLAAMPEDQRREILEQLSFSALRPEDQKTYAELVRQYVPADERAGSFAHVASELVDGAGYGKVSTFLDTVGATPEERAAAAKQTAESQLASLGESGNVTRQEVDDLREWLTRQAPGQSDSITGKALAEAAQEHGKFKYPEAARLALQYQQSSGNDEVLISFLESYSARSNLQEAKHLAENITDPQRREEILKRLK